MKLVYDVYSDAGHSWVKVELKELIELGIHLAITPYSYMRGDYAYLKEDCDFSTFLDAKYKTTSKDVRMREHHSEQSRVRTYKLLYYILVMS